MATSSIAGLSPQLASETIAQAFAAKGAQVAVVPLGTDGADLAAAVRVAAPESVFAAAGTPTDVGDALLAAAERGGGTLVLDLTACTATDLGAGLLARFGEDPTAALAAARSALSAVDVVGLVPEDQAQRPLTGLEGHASTQLRAEGATLQEILAFDAKAERWAGSLGVEAGPGSGAAGGIGLLVTAMGGRVVDPLTWLGERYGISATLSRADLAVTGAELLEFHAVGGPVVKRMIAWAEEKLCPVIAIAGRNYVSSRELRLAGLEAAHALRDGPAEDVSTPDELDAAATRVAASWAW